MIEELRIHSLGVIEESVLELGPGLSVITGETGAGKTMLVTALGLLLGGRADSGAVRTGARSARVEGLVRADPALAAAAEELGGEAEDDRLLLARQVSAEGRSRAFVGGASVPASALTALSSALVAVHGQSDQHRLLRADAQRGALDAFAGAPAAELLESFGRDRARLRTVEAELRDVVTSARERAREADVLRLGLAEIEQVDPRPGEDAELGQEETRLGFADTLRAAAEQAREALSSDQEDPDALGAVAAARRALDGVREHDPEAADLADRVAEVSYLLADVAADVASYASRVDTDPARLAAVSARRAALTTLTRKYADTLEEVLEWARVSSLRLLELDGSEGRADALRAERADLRSRLAVTGAALSQVRTGAAGELAEAVTHELHALAMPHARLCIDVRQTAIKPGEIKHSEIKHSETERTGPPGAPDGLDVEGRLLTHTATGLDEVELLLAANTGSEPRPLHKGASGGELSRVMLALEVVLAASSPVPTFVFDEVDAGVGGKAAVEIGRRLARLATTAQVLVVTHLPQVAAFADSHVVVRKAGDGSVTTSGLDVLDDAGRVRELSRMLAGLEQSETAMAHAEELLSVARDARTSSVPASGPRRAPSGLGH